VRVLKIFFINISLLGSFLFANEIETVLKIKPPITYSLDQKYDEALKYAPPKIDDKLSDYDVDVDIGIDEELMMLDKLKIDIGKTFKGIN